MPLGFLNATFTIKRKNFSEILFDCYKAFTLYSDALI